MTSNGSLRYVSPDSTNEPCTGATAGIESPSPGNDNAERGAMADTASLLARPEVVQCLRATLRRYRVAPEDMADAIADVQTASLETACTRGMPSTPSNVAQWKALATTIAAHWAVDRLREAKVRRKYDAGLCEDADAYVRPTLHWEHRDPVDTKRYLAILKELFDSGQMPEHGQEILQGEADGVPLVEIAAELGIGASVVRGRLFRMRARFRARLAALGMQETVAFGKSSSPVKRNGAHSA